MMRQNLVVTSDIFPFWYNQNERLLKIRKNTVFRNFICKLATLAKSDNDVPQEQSERRSSIWVQDEGTLVIDYHVFNWLPPLRITERAQLSFKENRFSLNNN